LATIAEGILLFDTVPREVGYSREYVDNAADFQNWIAESNGISDCWVSYFSFPVRKGYSNYGDAVYRFARFDKIPMDTDIAEGYECAMLLHEKLTQQGILHRVDFSGRTLKVRAKLKGIGYHLFVPIVENVTYPTSAFKNVTTYLNELVKRVYLKEYGVDLNCLSSDEKCPKIWNKARKCEQQLDGKTGTRGVGKEKDCLMSCSLHHEPFDQIVNKVGLGGMTRYPNTLNIHRGRFCVPLTEQQLEELDPFQIAELSKKQNFAGNPWIGDHLYIIPSRFDVKPPPVEETQLMPASRITSTSGILSKKKDVAYCIRYLLTLPDLDFEQRFFVILCLRDLGLTQQETEGELKKSLDSYHFKHITSPSPGEDLVTRCYNGKQSGEWLKGGCKSMRRASKCDPDCKRTHPYCI